MGPKSLDVLQSYAFKLKRGKASQQPRCGECPALELHGESESPRLFRGGAQYGISRFESGPGLSQTTGRPSGQSFLYRKPLTGANHNLTLPQKRVIFNSFLSSPWVRVTPRPLGYRSTCPRRRIPILKFSRKKARSTRRIRWNLIEKEGRAGHDPAALGVAILRSIQLSYRPKGGTNGAGE